MDFSRTPHVRIYTAVSPTAKLWGFYGRLLMEQLVKAADRAGVIPLVPELREGDVARAVAFAIGCPDVEWVAEHLPKLLADEAVAQSDDGEVLVVTKYHEAQYCKGDKGTNNKMSDRKIKDTRAAIEAGYIAAPEWYRDREATG